MECQARADRQTDALRCPSALNDAVVGDAAPSKYMKGVLKQRAHRILVDKLVQHPAWSAGAGIEHPWLGIRPELVDTASSREEVRRRATHMFKYDAVPTPNPPGSHRAETVCCERYGGLCGSALETPLCQTLVRNTHVVLRRVGINKSRLPLLVRFAGPLPDAVAA